MLMKRRATIAATIFPRLRAPLPQRLLSAALWRSRRRKGHDLPPERQKSSTAAAAGGTDPAVAGIWFPGAIPSRNRQARRLPIAAAGFWRVQFPPVFQRSRREHSGKRIDYIYIQYRLCGDFSLIYVTLDVFQQTTVAMRSTGRKYTR